MKSGTLHRHLAVSLSLVGALGCKDGFDVGTTKPDSGRSGGQVGHSGTGGSFGSGGGLGTGGSFGTAVATGGRTGTVGTGGTVTIPDARSVEDASAAIPDTPVIEPDGATDVSKSPADAPGGSICSLPAEIGPCEARLPRYFYNQATGSCELFYYGGCEGNDNRFDTLDACASMCLPGGICALPADMGPCDGVCPSYWYNQATGRCEQFGWGCCGGNANRFDTLEACMNACDPGLADAAATDGRETGVGGAGGAGGGDGPRATGDAAGADGRGGAGGMDGATGAGGALGKACTTSEECPSDAICCDASDPFCDGTLLPVGDSTDPGELVVSADGLTVTDTVTGLIWQRDGSGVRPGCSVEGSLRCSWPEAQAYCASLVLGGVSGWRLPGWKELFTITDLTKEPWIATIDLAAFPDTPNESFWAFQGLSGSSSSGQMYVDFFDATVDYTAQASLRVRCVRGARCYPKSRFVVLDAQDNADGLLVRDALTGLVWQQLTERPPPTCRPWADAQSYCSSLGPGFRLPTLKEMHTILTVGLILDRTFFQTSECRIAWTSSPYGGPDVSVTGYARVRDEAEMNPYNWNRLDFSRGVRCVR